jgi:hypothetical protein
MLEVTVPEQQLLYRLRQLAKIAGCSEVLVVIESGRVIKVAKMERLNGGRA